MTDTYYHAAEKGREKNWYERETKTETLVLFDVVKTKIRYENQSMHIIRARRQKKKRATRKERE